MILYLAIFLVVAGFIILGYSIYMTYAKAGQKVVPEAEGRAVSAPSSADPARPGSVKVPEKDEASHAFDAVHPVVPPPPEGETGPFVARTPVADPAEANVPAQVQAPHEIIPPVIHARTETAPEPEPASEPEHRAVLFDDASGMIDYNGASGKINPMPEAYRNLKRIGRGRIVYEKEGISFYCEQKIFRYDFHRIRDIKTGETHLAVFMTGQDAVKLFIFESPDPIINRIGGDFRILVNHVR